MTCRLCQGREQRRGFLVEGWYSSYFCCPTKRGRVSLKCRLFHHGYLFALSWQSCDPVTFDVYCHFVPSQANPRLGGSLLYQKKHKTIRLQTRLDLIISTICSSSKNKCILVRYGFGYVTEWNYFRVRYACFLQGLDLDSIPSYHTVFTTPKIS